ncbi:unnamed protein product [Notodromas monacha]|uniref:Uncharacterized protein n=1 Tax=Notodromas monacha TaxID=399045 RepID=A0A7R9G9Z7_9CRUS|nr:unnamed protein product [Notodromas monacha]CAG0913593.1 unnamed protein product [Notodromas monacha]
MMAVSSAVLKYYGQFWSILSKVMRSTPSHFKKFKAEKKDYDIDRTLDAEPHAVTALDRRRLPPDPIPVATKAKTNLTRNRTLIGIGSLRAAQARSQRGKPGLVLQTRQQYV